MAASDPQSSAPSTSPAAVVPAAAVATSSLTDPKTSFCDKSKIKALFGENDVSSFSIFEDKVTDSFGTDVPSFLPLLSFSGAGCKVRKAIWHGSGECTQPPSGMSIKPWESPIELAVVAKTRRETSGVALSLMKSILLKANVTKKAAVIVGSGMGTWIAPASAFGNHRVFAFDQHPLCVELSLCTAAFNSIASAEVINAVVGRRGDPELVNAASCVRDATVLLGDERFPSEETNSPAHKKVEVPRVALHDYFKSTDFGIALLFVDTVGNEADVVASALRLLPRIDHMIVRTYVSKVQDRNRYDGLFKCLVAMGMEAIDLPRVWGAGDPQYTYFFAQAVEKPVEVRSGYGLKDGMFDLVDGVPQANVKDSWQRVSQLLNLLKGSPKEKNAFPLVWWRWSGIANRSLDVESVEECRESLAFVDGL
jgi:hypothetical protein